MPGSRLACRPDMITKATDNLECAALLAEQYDYYDSAANRAYYAAYHACWHYLEAQGVPVPTEQRGAYSRHDKILNALEDEARFRCEQEFDFLQQKRVKADYTADKLDQRSLADALQYAVRIVEWVWNNARK